ITGSTTTLSGTVTIETERAGAGAVNEQQAITLNVGSAAGTFRVSIPWNGRTYTTAALPLTASAADVQTAINNAVGATTGTVSVTKNTDGTAVTFTLTYSGAFAAKNLDNAQVSVLADAPS
ncbi:MAG: hypothetical protein ACK6EB_20520, partial [Planctomyces sp.]